MGEDRVDVCVEPLRCFVSSSHLCASFFQLFYEQASLFLVCVVYASTSSTSCTINMRDYYGRPCGSVWAYAFCDRRGALDSDCWDDLFLDGEDRTTHNLLSDEIFPKRIYGNAVSMRTLAEQRSLIRDYHILSLSAIYNFKSRRCSVSSSMMQRCLNRNHYRIKANFHLS